MKIELENMPKDALTTTQAAEVLGVTRGRIQQLIANGELPAFTINAHANMVSAKDVKKLAAKPDKGKRGRKPKA